MACKERPVHFNRPEALATPLADGDEPAVFMECFAPVRGDLLRTKLEQEILG